MQTNTATATAAAMTVDQANRLIAGLIRGAKGEVSKQARIGEAMTKATPKVLSTFLKGFLALEKGSPERAVLVTQLSKAGKQHHGDTYRYAVASKVTAGSKAVKALAALEVEGRKFSLMLLKKEASAGKASPKASKPTVKVGSDTAPKGAKTASISQMADQAELLISAGESMDSVLEQLREELETRAAEKAAK